MDRAGVLYKICQNFAKIDLHPEKVAAEHGEQKTVMIDATYLKAHRTATSLAAKNGGAVA